MGKLQSSKRAARSRQYFHENEPDCTAPIDQHAVGEMVASINRDCTPSDIGSNIPESPGAEKLARLREEMGQQLPDEILIPAKCFQRPVSSGKTQASGTFTFGKANPSSKLILAPMARAPIHAAPLSVQHNSVDLVVANLHCNIAHDKPSLQPNESVERPVINPSTKSQGPRIHSRQSTPAEQHAVSGKAQAAPAAELNSVPPFAIDVRAVEPLQQPMSDPVAGHQESDSSVLALIGSFDFAPRHHRRTQTIEEQEKLEKSGNFEQVSEQEQNSSVPESPINEVPMQSQTEIANDSDCPANTQAPEPSTHATQVTNDNAHEDSVAQVFAFDTSANQGHGNDDLTEDDTLLAIDLTPNAEVSQTEVIPQAPRKQRRRAASTASTTANVTKQFRVTKTRPGPKVKKLPANIEQTRTLSSAASIPSSEDLYFLLMHRNRMQEQAKKDLLASQQELKEINARLLEDNQRSQVDLDAARERYEEAVCHLKSREASLNDYKFRFEKLKVWTKNMSKTYEDLHSECKAMKESESALGAAKEEIKSESRILRDSIMTTSASVVQFKMNLSEVYGAIQPLEQAVQDAGKELSAANAQVKRQQSHIAEISAMQKAHNKDVTKEWRKNNARLDKIEEVLVKIDKGVDSVPKQTPSVDKCLKILKTVHETGQVTAENLEPLHSALAEVAEKLTIYQSSALEATKAAATSGNTLRTDLVAEVTAIVDSLRSDVLNSEELSAIKVDNAELEVKVQALNALLEDRRRNLAAADTREEHARALTDKLADTLSNGQKNRSADFIRQATPLADSVNQLTIKYGHISADRAIQQNRADAAEKALEEKKQELHEVAETLEAEKAWKNTALQQLEELRAQSQAQASEAATLLNIKLSEKESEINEMGKNLEDAATRISEITAQIEGLNTEHSNEQRQHQKARDVAEEAARARDQANEEIRGLSAKLSELCSLRDEAAKVPGLISDLGACRRRISELQTECNEFDHVRIRNSELGEKASTMAKKVEEFGAQAESLQKSEEANCRLQQQVANGDEDISKLRFALEETQKVADQVPNLKMGLREKLTELKHLMADVKRLEEALSDAKSIADHNEGLEEELKARDGEIHSLTTTVSGFETALTKAQDVAGRMPSLEAELHDKNEENEGLQSRLAALNDELAEWKAKAGRVVPLYDDVQKKAKEIEKLNSTIALLNVSLANANRAAVRVPSLEGSLREQASEMESLTATNTALTSDLTIVQEKVDRLECVQNEAKQKDTDIASLNFRLCALKERLEESQTKANKVSSLQEDLATKAATIASLNSQASNAEYRSQQIRELETSANKWQSRSNDLGRELEAAKVIVAKCVAFEDAHVFKDIKIAELQDELTKAKSKASNFSQLQEEWGIKTTEIAGLHKRVAELEKDSPEIPESNWQNADTIPENFLSQDTILSLSQITTGNASREANPGRGKEVDVAGVSASNRAERTRLAAMNAVPNSTLSGASDPGSTQRTDRVPDTQLSELPNEITAAIKDSQDPPKRRSASSSSLTDLSYLFSSGSEEAEDDDPAEFTQFLARGAVKTRTPVKRLREDETSVRNKPRSSSSHGEPMLLEHLECEEDEESLTRRLAKRFGTEMSHPEGRFPNADLGISPAPAAAEAQPPQAMPRNRMQTTREGRKSGPASLRGGHVSKDTALTETSPSRLNAPPSSPFGSTKERHQPNSAAKRRVEFETPPSTLKTANKRLKRIPRNLDISKTSKESSISTRDTALTSRYELPSASRKGSIIGTNAPAPGKSQRSKATRKGSRNERYSTRFSQE